jgi:prepilin-type N-terminal cleavage/methylation domain-containing protein
MSAELRRQAGFTLIEALVAFAILGLSFAALFAGIGGAARGERSAQFQLRATRFARSRLEELGVATPIRPGVVENENSEFAWRLALWPYGGPQVAVRAYWAQITVRPAGTNSPSVTLTTMKTLQAIENQAPQ